VGEQDRVHALLQARAVADEVEPPARTLPLGCSDGLFFTCAYTRSVQRPWALEGGHEGSRNYVELIRRDGSREQHAIATALELNEGDLIRIHTANGGGYGDPRRRLRAKVREDLRDGLITETEAVDTYSLGVVAPGRATR
jgi:N-methylhydantoinase B